jgi:hypothetical protein
MLTMALVCLMLVAVTCFLGTFSPYYDDNLPQRVGMAVIFFFCVSKMKSLNETQYVETDLLIMYFGMMVYAVGTVYKVARRPNWNGVERRKVQLR